MTSCDDKDPTTSPTVREENNVPDSAEPTSKPTQSPVRNSTSRPTVISDDRCSPVCVDFPEGWHDSGGSGYDCKWYSKGKFRFESLYH